MAVKTPLQHIPKQPLAVTAYEAIIKKIICLEYPPNTHLEESQLMKDLAIGRTPIREALVRLLSERMVESHPNKGVIVKPITLQNTKAMFESMIIFEFGVVDTAMKKNVAASISGMKSANRLCQKAIESNDMFALVEANHEFHIEFARCSQNEFLIQAVNDVRSEAKRLSYLSYDNIIDPERPLESHYESVVTEHAQLIEGMILKDEAGLKTLISDHITTFRERVIRFMIS